jgi:hypothetical protein
MKPLLASLLVPLAALAVGCGSRTTTYDARIEVAFSDVPFATDTSLRIGYTLKTWEWEKDGFTLQELAVLDEQTGAVLVALDQASLPKVFKDPLPTNPYFTFDTITSYYLSLQLPIPLATPPPARVFHRFRFTGAAGTTEIKGAPFAPRTGEQPRVIAAPIKGDNLIFINLSTNGYHFNTMLFMEGGIFYPERYAFDTSELDPNLILNYDNMGPDAHADNTKYYNYGRTLYAVADGTVVHLQDGRTENQGDTRDVASALASADEYGGNYLILDIGGGHFAYYCHIIPGSYQVAVGATVKEGDPLAKLGNSGNSDLPHLHFHVSDASDLWHAHGVPIAFKTYTRTGTYVEPGPGAATPPAAFTNAMMENTDVIAVP